MDHADRHRDDRQYRDHHDHRVDGGAEVGDRGDRQGQGHHQDGPDEPAHPVPVGTGRAPVAQDRGRHRDQHPGDVRIPLSGRSTPAAPRGGERQVVEVDVGGEVGDVGGSVAGLRITSRTPTTMPAESADADPAEPAGQEPAGREDQQQRGDAEGQDRSEPVQEPQRQVGAGVGVRRRGPRTARRTGRHRPAPRPRRSGAGPSRSAAAGVRGRRRARRARWPDRPRCRRQPKPGPSSMPGPSSGAATSKTNEATTRTRLRPQPAPRRRQDPFAGAPKARHRRCRASGSVDRAHQWSYRTSSPDQTSAERCARSPTRKPTEVTTSHSAATGPAMYSSGETPSSTARPPMHQPDTTDPARHDAQPAGRVDGQTGQPGEHPHPRDGADPVVVERSRGVRDGAFVARRTAPSSPRCRGPRRGRTRPRCRAARRTRRSGRSSRPRHDAAGGTARRRTRP